MDKEKQTSVKVKLRQITREECLQDSLKVIKDSFLTVAREFNFTEEKCPSNPAFTSLEKLQKMRDNGISMFGLFTESQQIGFVALEKSQDNTFYIERLAVLPEFRHKGYGKALLDYMFNYAKAQESLKVSIGIVNENLVLKKWYRSYGFRETALKKFEHLPFTVCFMEKQVD